MTQAEELTRFNFIKTRYLAEALKYANNRFWLADTVGNLLEHLVALSLRYSGFKIKRRKTKGIDLIAQKKKDPTKQLAIEATNWEITSYPDPNYFSNKLNALVAHSYLCKPLWIMSYKACFTQSDLTALENSKIEVLELGKQLIPQTLSFQDYKDLKALLRRKLREIGFLKR